MNRQPLFDLRRARVPALVALWILALAGTQRLSATSSVTFSITDWSVVRVRKTVESDNVVTSAFQLKNTSRFSANNVVIHIEYMNAGKVDFTTRSKRIGTISPGQRVAFQTVDERVPAFESYQIEIAFTDRGKRGKRLYYGATPYQSPVAFSDTPIPRMAKVVCLGHTLTLTGRTVSGSIRIRNMGELPAENLKAIIRFQKIDNGKPIELHRKTVTLNDGKLDGDTTKTIKIHLSLKRKVPDCDELTVSITHDPTPPEMRLSGRPFAGINDVELGEYAISRDGNNLMVKGKVRNGRSEDVDGIVVTLAFTRFVRDGESLEVKRHTFAIPGRLAPGRVNAFLTIVNDVGKFDDIREEIAYQTGEPVEVPVRFTGDPIVEMIVTELRPQPDGSITVVGAFRNGLTSAIQDVSLTIRFMANGATLTETAIPFKGLFASNAEQRFQRNIPGCGAYDEWSFTYSYKTPSKKPLKQESAR